ncbi:MAG: glycoside hydrolase family 16 protein [Trebonia sp.]
MLAVGLAAACTTVPATPATPSTSAAPATPSNNGRLAGALDPPPNYKLAFSTVVPGTSLDTATWAECYPWSPKPPGCTNFGNSDEREWYLPSQVHVENGALALIPSDGSWPPEIDIVEHWDTQQTASATLHTGKQNATQRGTIDFPEADEGWHTYTLYWTQSQISVYYDGTLALRTTKSIPQKAMYLLLDLADENNSPGSCAGTMYVKSVNVWQPS